MARSNRNSQFTERINWPLSLWLFIAIMLCSIFLTLWAPFNTQIALMATLLILLALIYAHYKTRLEIVVFNNWLYVGKAKIELKFIQSAKVLDKVEFSKISGVNADPAAFTTTRFWIKTGVVIKLKDKLDPTPYWLISTRKAQDLVDCFN